MKYLGGLAVALLLSACGGGSPPPPTTTAPLFTTAPSALTVGVGSLSTFDIRGGSSPYTAVSNNVGVAISLVNGSVLTLGGVAEGTAGVSIRDAAGAAINVDLTVSNGPSRPLFTEAPSTLTLAPGLTGAQTYRVGGGAGPYTATSSNASVVSVVVNGSNMTITGLKAGIGDVRILDSLGGTVTVSVTVAANSDLQLFTTAPSGLTVAVGSNPSYGVGGGTGPYTATSSNAAVATVGLVGATLTVNGLTAGTASVVVRDSAGTTVAVAVTVTAASNIALFTTAPPSVTVAIGASPTYSVGGGSGAGYTATSTNAGIASVSLVGTSLTVTGVTVGNASVVVQDNAGATVTFTVSVGTLTLAVTPSNATGIINDVLIATITGGTPPYRASVGNILVATAAVQNSNELRIQLLQVGQTIVTVLDANNQSVAYSLTSNAATPGIRLSPGAVTTSENDNQSIFFTVFGNAPGAFNVFSSDTTRLIATIDPANPQRIIVNTGTNGNRRVIDDTNVTITVIDSTRATGVAVIKIEDNLPPPPLVP